MKNDIGLAKIFFMTLTITIGIFSITSCGGGGGGTDSNDNMTQQDSLDQLVSMVKEHDQDAGNWHYIFCMDLGGDGDDDLVYLNAIDNYSTEQRDYFNLAYFTNNGNAGFTKTVTNIMAFARDVVVADYNGDGLDDVFMAEHGYDRSPFPGAYNYLLLQDGNGGLINASNQIPQVIGFWHGGETFDVNKDGHLDLLATSLHDGVFVYINDGNANFTQDDAWIPAQDLRDFANNTAFYTWLKAIDLDVDTYEEIILGGAEGAPWYTSGQPKAPILRHEVSNFSFDQNADTFNTYYVDEPNDNEQVITEMQSIDINQDGCDDLAVYSTDYVTNGVISIFQSDCTGSLTLAQRIVYADSPDVLHVRDLNQDGLLDIYTSSSNIIDFTPHILINKGDGTFEDAQFTDDLDIDIATFVAFN